MPIEIQISDMLSRVIERTQPTSEIVSQRVKFDISPDGRLVRWQDHHADTYYASEIRKEGFFREHSIPNAARWVRNPRPRNVFEVFVKRQIVYTPEPAGKLTEPVQA